MTEAKKLYILSICQAIVAGEFATYSNTANQGVSFTWEQFPIMMANKCRTEIFLYESRTDKDPKEVQDLAWKMAHEFAIRLVGRAATV